LAPSARAETHRHSENAQTKPPPRCRAHNTANEPKVTAPLQRGGGLPGVGKAAWSFVGRGGLHRTKGKGFAGGAEGFSCCEAAEQPIETNPKAGQRSNRRTQSKPVKQKK